MILFKYLDHLPAIPDELLVDFYNPDDIEFEQGIETYRKSGIFRRHSLKSPLDKWLRENIVAATAPKSSHFTGLQEMTAHNGVGEILPHTDFRKWSLNYILECGGDKVSTEFYKMPGKDLFLGPNVRLDDPAPYAPVYKVVIQPHRWHIINANVLHAVRHIESARRAVSLGLMEFDPFPIIKNHTD